MKQLERSFYSKASMYSFLVVLGLLLSLWIATDGLKYLKPTQMGYIIGSLIFGIGLAIRMVFWMYRTATNRMVKRSLINLKSIERFKRNWKSILITAINNIFLQKFIFKRGIYRGIQHWLIAWGCIGAFGVTFALVFGWVRFDLVTPELYQIVVFNIPTITLHPDGFLASMTYNALNIFSLLLLVGLSMALFRRMTDPAVRVTQRFEFDILPLIILLAVTVSGLLLTVSYKFLDGWMHHPMALVHHVTVVVMLIYFPFGKLFHLPIRPLAAAVPMNYQEVLQVDTKECAGCKQPYSNDAQIEDVKAILGDQNFDFQMEDGTYLSDYCTSCRRRIRVMKQMNMEAPKGNPYDPISTMNDIHISGFGKKRSDEFYNLPKKEEKEKVIK
ncbi:MFS transporter [Cytobacillus suaedae]|nr:MFS transporter [Cytobacillus suaedae]